MNKANTIVVSVAALAVTLLALPGAAKARAHRHHRPRLEAEGRKHRAKLVNLERLVALGQHITTPVAYSHDEHLDLEIVGRLPLSENLQDPLLGVLVLDRRSLRTFVPAEHVLHWVLQSGLKSSEALRD